MTDLSTLHPLFPLAFRIALASLAYPLAWGCARLALGRARMASLRLERPFTEALLFAVAVFPLGLVVGLDALDPRLVGPALALSPPARGASALFFGLLAALPLLGTLRTHARDLPSSPVGEPSLLVLLLTSLVPTLAFIALRSATVLEQAPYAAATLARAPLRAAVVPTDATARLSLGFRFASADDLDRAREEITFARAFGADPSRVLELESELAARMGDCPRAERLFRLSIEQSLGAGLTAPGSTPLRLGGYFLPPSLVTRCRFGARDTTTR